MASVAQIIRKRRNRKARRRIPQSNNRRWLILVTAIVVLVVVIPAGVTLGGAAWLYRMPSITCPAPNKVSTLGQPVGQTQLYDRCWRNPAVHRAESDSDDGRNWLKLDTLPSYVLQATLVMEDPSFLQSTAFDPLSTFSKMWRNILIGPLAAGHRP